MSWSRINLPFNQSTTSLRSYRYSINIPWYHNCCGMGKIRVLMLCSVVLIVYEYAFLFLWWNIGARVNSNQINKWIRQWKTSRYVITFSILTNDLIYYLHVKNYPIIWPLSVVSAPTINFCAASLMIRYTVYIFFINSQNIVYMYILSNKQNVQNIKLNHEFIITPKDSVIRVFAYLHKI